MGKSILDAIHPADGWVDGTIDWISVEYHSYARAWRALIKAIIGMQARILCGRQMRPTDVTNLVKNVFSDMEDTDNEQ